MMLSPVAFLCIFWGVFQLLTSDLLLLDSLIIRSLHLAFALGIAFLSIFKEKKILKWPLFILSVFSSLYFCIFFEEIGSRQGLPNLPDQVFGFILIGSVLLATYQIVGKGLTFLVMIGLFATFFSSYLPEVIASKDVSLSRLVSKLTLSTEGIYGIPLAVSSQTVYYFVLFGALLEQVGAGKFFIDLAFSLLGGFRGGPAKAAVLASGLTGTCSGSSIANTVTTGTFTIPLMKRCGYPSYKAAAIEVAASTNGQLMPPVMGAAAFLIAEYCNLPYFEVIKGAFIPAFASYITLLFIVHIEARKLGIQPVPKNEIPSFFSVLIQGWHFLLPFFYLFYTLLVMRLSASLSAYLAILVLCAVEFIRVLLLVASKKKNFREGVAEYFNVLIKGLRTGSENMVAIAIAVSSAGMIVGIVSLGLGGKLTAIVAQLSMGNFYGVLLITALFSIILGLGLPTTANYIVMANLTVPIIVTLGSQWGYEVPLLAAHLFCFYFGILADDTPPVGLASLAGSAIAGSNPIKTGIQSFIYDLRTAILPFLFVLNPKILCMGDVSLMEGIFWFFITLGTLFSFAVLLQNFFLAKLRFFEQGILVLVLGTLLFAHHYENLLGLSFYLTSSVALFALFGVFFTQRRQLV